MIQLCTDEFPGMTCVPNVFIDERMGHANGDFVKIYLYLLRALSAKSSSLSIGSLADAMNFTEADVVRALRYWERSGDLRLSLDDSGDITRISVCSGVSAPKEASPVSAAPAPAPVRPAPVPAPMPIVHAVPQRPQFSPDELDSFRSEEAVAELLFVSETYMGRPLSVNELEMILYWHRDLELPIDLIEHLIESCLSANHPSFPYMNTVAQKWHTLGIRTVDEARATAEVQSVAYYSIKSALGISGRELVDKEKELIMKWTDEYGFSLDIIKDACRRTVEQASSPTLKYADSILTKWHKAGVRRLSDVAPLDAAHQSRSESRTPASGGLKLGFSSRSEESMEELEKRLLLSTGQ